MDTGSTNGAGMPSFAQPRSEGDDIVCNDACGPLRLALLSANVLASPVCAVAWPSNARAEIGDKIPDNSGQLPLQSVQFITLQAATGVVLLSLSPSLPNEALWATLMLDEPDPLVRWA